MSDNPNAIEWPVTVRFDRNQSAAVRIDLRPDEARRFAAMLIAAADRLEQPAAT